MASPATSPAPAHPLLLAEAVGKRFGDHVVLRGVDLAVAEREVVCVIGPSGSGKTTLLRCMALLEQPSEGRILMDGETIAAPASRSSTTSNRRSKRAERRRAGRPPGTARTSAPMP